MQEENREIEFIVAQQAQFAADIQLLKELVKGHQDILKDQQELIREQFNLIKEQYHQYANQMTHLVDIVGDLKSIQQDSTGLVGGLAQKVADTDDRVNTLITMVERFMSGHS